MLLGLRFKLRDAGAQGGAVIQGCLVGLGIGMRVGMHDKLLALRAG